MQAFRKLVAMLLLALWAPATSICLLERAGWLAPDDCCVNTSAVPADEPVENFACCLIASGSYKIDEEQGVTLADPVLLDFSAIDLDARIARHDFSAGPLQLAPPEFQRSWQFLLRAAQPPRAPSAAS